MIVAEKDVYTVQSLKVMAAANSVAFFSLLQLPTASVLLTILTKVEYQHSMNKFYYIYSSEKAAIPSKQN